MGEGCGDRMEVDERRWPSFGAPASSSSSTSAASAAASIPVTATVAPPQQEERRVAEEATSLISDDLDMDVCQVVQQQHQQNQQPQQVPPSTWSWSDENDSATRCSGGSVAHTGFDLFESIQVCLSH